MRTRPLGCRLLRSLTASELNNRALTRDLIFGLLFFLTKRYNECKMNEMTNYDPKHRELNKVSKLSAFCVCTSVVSLCLFLYFLVSSRFFCFFFSILFYIVSKINKYLFLYRCYPPLLRLYICTKRIN
jgi:hypothetical protein